MKPRKEYIARSTKPIKQSRVRATGKPSRRFAARRDKAYCEWVRTKPCVIAVRWWAAGVTDTKNAETCRVPVECAHVIPRSCGGDDKGNTAPLCVRHHRQQHSMGIESFQRFYDVDLAAIAERLGREYEA